MKNTRRFIAGLSAMALAAAIAPMSAFADTEVKQDSTDKTGIMTATYDVSAKYTVTIPSGVTLDSQAPVSKSISASDVMLESEQKIKVSLTEASNTESGSSFSAKNDKGDSTATYTIGKDEATTGISVGDVVAEFTADGTQALTFSKAEGATYAGEHTETLTFTIETDGGTQNIEFTLAVMAELTNEKITLPVPVGKKWQDFATYISNEDFSDAIDKAIAHDTSVYPANKFYCNETYGVSYYTGDKLYLLFNIVDFDNSETSGLLPSDVVSKTNTYGAQDVLSMMQ